MLQVPNGKLLAIDTETTGLQHWLGDQPFAVSICNEQFDTAYVEWPVDPFTRTVYPDRRELKLLREMMADDSIEKVFHNASFDLRMFSVGLGIKKLRGQIHDTTASCHVAYSDEIDYKLKRLAAAYCGIENEDEKDLKKAVVSARLKAKKLGWALHADVEADYWMPRALDPNNDLCEQYAVTDVVRTMSLWLMTSQIMEEDNIRHSYDFEMEKLFPILWKMETRGVSIDPAVVEKEAKKCRRVMHDALQQMRIDSGDEEFDPMKPDHLKWFLFDVLKLKPRLLTKTGNPSTSAEALDQYQNEESLQPLFMYRAAEKRLTAFFNVYQQFTTRDECDYWSDRFSIHPSFKQHGKRTGRLSMPKPNLQGIADPEKSVSKVNIDVDAKRPFGPRPGYVWLLADYSQLEIRIFAAVSRDPDLISMLESDRDLHTETTDKAWGGDGNPRAIKSAREALEYNVAGHGSSPEVRAARKKWGKDAEGWLASFNYSIVEAEASLGKKNSRSRGKRLFFMRMFGGGPYKASMQLNVTLEEGKDFVRAYDEALPGVTRYVNETVRRVRNDHYITTMYGRRLDVSPEFAYKGASYEVQGTAADLIKRAMLSIDDFFVGHDIDAHLLLQIHDELIMEIREDLVTHSFINRIRHLMEQESEVVGIAVPTSMEIATKAWSNTVKVSEYMEGKA